MASTLDVLAQAISNPWVLVALLISWLLVCTIFLIAVFLLVRLYGQKVKRMSMSFFHGFSVDFQDGATDK